MEIPQVVWLLFFCLTKFSEDSLVTLLQEKIEPVGLGKVHSEMEGRLAFDQITETLQAPGRDARYSEVLLLFGQ